MLLITHLNTFSVWGRVSHEDDPVPGQIFSRNFNVLRDVWRRGNIPSVFTP